MTKLLTVAVLTTLGVGWAAAAGDEGKRAPVLVELFTSEGCSSCPPADVLLESLDRTQPVASAEIIVLSEHVDYWNRIGWTDPFSSPQFSRRQEAYANRFKGDGAYTPQMVVDGVTQFVGSDGRRALAEIGKASGAPKATVKVSAAGKPFRVQVDVTGAANGDVFVALARNEAVSQVTRGENGGRQLRHVAVVDSLIPIGSVKKGESFSKEVDLPGAKQGDPQRYRIVAFVQERGQGRVLGSALFRPMRESR